MFAEVNFNQHSNQFMNRDNQARAWALALYRQTSESNVWRRLWDAMRGRSHSLLNLAQVLENVSIVSQHHSGRQMVAVSQIKGSASKGRGQDFDADFRPLSSHDESRWINVAAAVYQGKVPPVKLVKVGDIYFVEDGHHRVSVAQAMDQEEIWAEVTVIETASSPAAQPVAALV